MTPGQEPGAAASKRSWRRRLRPLWGAVDVDELALGAAAALAHLQQTEAWRGAAVVFTYVNQPREFPTRRLIEAAWAQDKRVAAPVTRPGGVMEAHVFSAWDQLAPAVFGILTPDAERCPRLDPSAIDLCIVPGLAFDRRGVRLGRGGGYYDRYLPRLRRDAVRVGWIPARFLVDELPVEPHDARVHLIATEQGIVRFAAAG
ncbi:MAG TPA: 5-formyltetrahydrofolate cyclo-ligase [Bacillota bacterium]